jgi:hypothetical protein
MYKMYHGAHYAFPYYHLSFPSPQIFPLFSMQTVHVHCALFNGGDMGKMHGQKN